jgi:hypothetical protein
MWRVSPRAQFCTTCRTHGIPVSAERVRVVLETPTLRNDLRPGFWSSARHFGEFRLINQTFKCHGRPMIVFSSAAPVDASLAPPPAEIVQDDGIVWLQVALGTLIPSRTHGAKRTRPTDAQAWPSSPAGVSPRLAPDIVTGTAGLQMATSPSACHSSPYFDPSLMVGCFPQPFRSASAGGRPQAHAPQVVTGVTPAPGGQSRLMLGQLRQALHQTLVITEQLHGHLGHAPLKRSALEAHIARYAHHLAELEGFGEADEGEGERQLSATTAESITPRSSFSSTTTAPIARGGRSSGRSLTESDEEEMSLG